MSAAAREIMARPLDIRFHAVANTVAKSASLLKRTHHHWKGLVLQRADIPRRHILPSSISKLATFEERLQAVRREFADPVIAFIDREIVVEKLPWRFCKLCESSIVISLPAWRWDAEERIQESKPCDCVTGGNENQSDNMSVTVMP
jgi:hypothetical protein